eukprot:scaffold6687_cov98-Isochrysis_galbana.AAC.4
MVRATGPPPTRHRVSMVWVKPPPGSSSLLHSSVTASATACGRVVPSGCGEGSTASAGSTLATSCHPDRCLTAPPKPSSSQIESRHPASSP